MNDTRSDGNTGRESVFDRYDIAEEGDISNLRQAGEAGNGTEGCPRS
jgi:hypothetical protein